MSIHAAGVSGFAFSRLQTTAALLSAVAVGLIFRDTFAFLFASWQRDEYSYGFLIPMISGVLLWQRWPEMRHKRFRPSLSGVPVVIVGLLAWWLASEHGTGVVETYALITVIGGCMLTLMGGDAFRLALAPLLLLIIMSPLPDVIDSVLLPALQAVSAHLGVAVMRLFGSSVLLEGGSIDLGAYKFNVAEGSRSLSYLMPLLTLGTILSLFIKSRTWVQATIILSTIPIAMAMDGLRIGSTGLLIDRYGVDPSAGAIATLNGWVIFMACVALLVAEVWLLLKVSSDPRRLREALAVDWPQWPESEAGDEPQLPQALRPRLLIVTSNFAPELTGIGKYVGEMTAWMARAGFDITVVTAPPYYPAWRVAPGYSSRRYARERLAGALVYRCPLLVPRRPRGMTRLLHMLSFSLSTLPVVIWQAVVWRPHLVFVIEPPLGCAPVGWVAAKLSGARSWLHVQDFEVDAAFDLGLLRGEQLRRAALGVESWLMRRFDRVSSISERMLAKLRDKGVAPSRIGYFPNWVDTDLIRPLAFGENLLRAELGIDADMIVLLYSGNMGEKQGLELIVDVARSFSPAEKIVFLLCGDGSAKRRTMDAASGLENVRFLPVQPLQRLNELLNIADVHLLPQRAEAEDLVMPSKLAAMMSSGRPVVASARPGTDVALAVGQGGLIVPPGDPEAFGAAIRSLLTDRSLRSELGKAGRAYAIASWDRERVLRPVAAQLEAAFAQVTHSATTLVGRPTAAIGQPSNQK